MKLHSLKTIAATLTTAGALALTVATPAVTHADSPRPNPTHLVQLYTRPQRLNWMESATISAACPDGGQVVKDPTNYIGTPFVPRASATNVFFTLASGGFSNSAISVNVQNGEQAAEIAAFEYTCLVPGAAPADAPPLATLTQRRAHW